MNLAKVLQEKSSGKFCVNFVGEAFIFLKVMCKLQSVVNFECDFSMLPNATDVHHNFSYWKRDIELSILCQFCWWNIYFLRDVCKLKSVVNFGCDFSLLLDAADIHYNFKTKKEILSYPFYVSFVGETFIFLRGGCKLSCHLLQ